jgi:ribose 5-phosphate isomerase RpiB
MSFAQAQAVVAAFLETNFTEDERHVRRLAKIEAYELGVELEED